jgi:drug/metabolite transporter (DMT)-like permease
MKKSWISWAALFACNFMWSLQFTCVKLVQDQVGAFSTVFLPMTIATLFMAPFVYRDAKRNKNRRLADVKIFFLLALLGQFPAQVLTTIGTQQSTASNAAIINLTLPVVSALLAVVLLKERMNSLRWFSFLIAFAGVLLCSSKEIFGADFSSRYLLGNLLVFSGVAGSGIYNTLCKKIAVHYTEMEMLFYTYVFLLLLMVPFVFYYEPGVIKSIPSFRGQTIMGLILLTVFHNFLSMLLFFKALKKLEAIQVALSNFLIAFFGLPIAVFVLGETLSWLAVIGGLLVLTSTMLITVWEYRQTALKPVPQTLAPDGEKQ